MSETNQLFSYDFRVYVGDTDFGGILYHANYLEFMERARTEHLISAGYQLSDLAQRNVFFAVRHANLDFKQPAKLNDMLTVTSQITGYRKSAIIFKQTVNNAQQQLLCEAEITLVCINQAIKPIAIPQDLLEKLL